MCHLMFTTNWEVTKARILLLLIVDNTEIQEDQLICSLLVNTRGGTWISNVRLFPKYQVGKKINSHRS